MEIKMVGVVGCGLMGSGIVETCARAGYQVVVREPNEPLLAQGLSRLRGSLAKGWTVASCRRPTRMLPWRASVVRPTWRISPRATW